MQSTKEEVDKVAGKPKDIDDDTIRLKTTPLLNQKKFVTKEGPLTLESSGGSGFCFCRGGATTRRCALDRNVLALWSSDSLSPLFMNFDTVPVELNRTSATSFEIYVPGRTETSLLLRADSEQEAVDWFRALQIVISSSYGSRLPLTKVLQQPHYQSSEFVLEEQFVRECDSGDILLFKANHTLARVQRALTFSDYDHVAIVLKNRKDEVIVFESNSSEGVAFTFWKQLLRYKWYNLVQKIAWRKLDLERTAQDIQTMEQFIVSNLNKNFDINWEKMWRRTSSLHKTEEEERKRTYFCSELVAAMYKKLGLLEQKKACTQYWPVSFSDARTLDLQRGTLEHERVLVFEEKIMGEVSKR